MRFSLALGQCALVLLQLTGALAEASPSPRVLSSAFLPPASFENTNLVRNINLERSYPRETTNIVVKNIAKDDQTEYFFQLPTALVGKVSGFEAANKKSEQKYTSQLAEYETDNVNSYYVITFSEPLKPSESLTLSISYALLSTTYALPAQIEQNEQQTITYDFSAYLPSAYNTVKQKSKLKLPTGTPAEFTRLEKNADGASDPIHMGSSLTYGPYDNIKAGQAKAVRVRYDFTKPMLRADRFERDIEVSQWGGNLAVEERYWLTNRAAKLKKQFSRVDWQQAQYMNPPSSAAKEVRLVLSGGASDAYFIDDVGNVSTSKFRPGKRETYLDLKPRYPVFGGWNYSFKVGWNGNLNNYLRKVSGESYVLKVPFLEGPRTDFGVEYTSIKMRVILPEGATNIKFSTSLPVVESHMTIHKTFMDTAGRPTVELTSVNAIEEWRDRGSLIVTYDYPWIAGFRKPITIAVSMFGVFFTAWMVGNLDLRIGKKK